jgi:hypothetical protein
MNCPNIVRIPVPSDPTIVRIELDPSVIRLETGGIPGPKGEPGRDGAGGYVVAQPIPSASWQVAHDFGRRPSVQVLDSNGKQVFPDVTSGEDFVYVVSAEPFSGFLVLT